MQVFVTNDVIVADFIFYLYMKAMMNDTFVRKERRMHEKEMCDSGWNMAVALYILQLWTLTTIFVVYLFLF